MCLRSEVLAFYKRVLRLSRNWVAKDASSTAIEREYIRNELRQQMEANRRLTDKVEIENKLREAKNRVAIAEHYGIPYPRPIYFKKGVVTGIRKPLIGNKREFSFLFG